jgi:hypothetical protein
MFKMSKAELNYRIWGMLMLASFLGYFINKAINSKNALKDEQSYTVGICLRTYKGIKQSLPFVEYEYVVENKKYKHSHDYSPRIYQAEVGSKYLVMYSPSNPENSRIMLKEILHDSIKAPIEGWANVPFSIKDSLDFEW